METNKKEEKKVKKQNKLFLKFKNRKEKKKNKNKYIKKGKLKKKFKNAQSFFNLDFVSDDGIINLKTGYDVKKVFLQRFKPHF